MTTPYASALGGETRVHEPTLRRKTLAVCGAAISVPAFVALCLLAGRLDSDLGPIAGFLVLGAGLPAGAVAALLLGPLSKQEDRICCAWLGTLVVSGGIYVVSKALAIAHLEPGYLILGAYLAIIVAPPALCGALFGVLIFDRLTRRRRAFRRSRVRRWNQLMPRRKFAPVARGEQVVAAILAPVGQCIFWGIIALPLCAVMKDVAGIGYLAALAGGAITGMLGAIGIGGERDFSTRSVVLPMLAGHIVVLPVFVVAFCWWPESLLYLGTSVTGLLTGALLTSVVMLRKRNGVSA
ncbi:MAG: hypothetical protein K8I27_00055 [Planctomycetes bacterium]|nr:hypothetical protein [Planctomycetota bacterium]